MSYDSTSDTIEHIAQVRACMSKAIKNLQERAERHDASKLVEPEKSVFDEMTPKLRASTYGSDEYKGFLSHMTVALDHHYAVNDHHPEHHRYYECGACFTRYPEPGTCPKCGYQIWRQEPKNLEGMTLLSILEMLCDWKAATLRHADGDLRRSIKINAGRFGYDSAMEAILIRTAEELGFIAAAEEKTT